MVGYSFGTFDLGIIVSKMRQYISSNGGFRFVMQKYYFGVSGRSDIPDVLANSCLDTSYFESWPQSISFDCREVRERKGCDHSDCPFCVRVTFDRSVCSYVVKLCQCTHTDHVVNLSSIPGHVRFNLIYLLRRRVSWQILVKLVIPVCSPRLHFAVYFLVEHMIQA